MKSYKLSELTQSEVDKLKGRPRIDFVSIFSKASLIFALVTCFELNLYISSTFCILIISQFILLAFGALTMFQVQPIVDDVCQRGDSAVKELVFVCLFSFFPCFSFSSSCSHSFLFIYFV